MYPIPPDVIETFNTILQQKGIELVCAESMTGGLFASSIIAAKGAMEVLKGGIIAYDTAVKTRLLHVPEQLIDRYTAESQETTDAMCQGLRQLYPYVNLFVAITGVAEKTSDNAAPEGQIYLSLFYQNELHRYETLLEPKETSDRRNAIRIQAVEYMMERILYIVTRAPVAATGTPET